MKLTENERILAQDSEEAILLVDSLLSRLIDEKFKEGLLHTRPENAQELQIKAAKLQGVQELRAYFRQLLQLK